jgi:two-component system, NtrC family, sensor histidine kinase KinB
MVLKTKLSYGLGFLFLIIFALAGFCSYYIEKLSRESENILKDNYNSIVFSKNMNSALDDIKTSIGNVIFNKTGDESQSNYYAQLFESGKAEFEKYLKSEHDNITEINEKEYVNYLNNNYEIFLKLSKQIMNGSGNSSVYFNEFLPACEKLKESVNNIYDINLQAVVRKNQLTKQDSGRIIIYMAVIGGFCIILALGYFWYFPFYVSNTMSYLSIKMRELLKKAGIVLDVSNDDETHIILQSINMLETVLEEKGSESR